VARLMHFTLRCRPVLASPSIWDRMGAADWDVIPQPIRALTYRHMTEYWAGHYDIGGTYAIPRGLMADTLARSSCRSPGSRTAPKTGTRGETAIWELLRPPRR
jgi:hypothetical protein